MKVKNQIAGQFLASGLALALVLAPLSNVGLANDTQISDINPLVPIFDESSSQLGWDEVYDEVLRSYPMMHPLEADLTTELLMEYIEGNTYDEQAIEQTRALPAAVLAVVARCALGTMSSVAIDELYNLIVKGKTATAEARIQSAIVGCVSGGLLPLPVRLAVKAAGPKVVAAAIVVGIRLRQICIPRCI